MVEMVRQCMTYDYRKRPDTFALLRHPTVQAKAAALKINLTPPPRNRRNKKPSAARLQDPELEPSRHSPVPAQDTACDQL
eukprot:scaffold447689_cov27-Prasinocladus_malaysianus.AAC.1